MRLVLNPDKEDGSQFPNFIVRKARKAWKCRLNSAGLRRWDGGTAPSDHAAVIEPGAQYVEYFGEVAAYQSGERYCAGCAVASGVAHWEEVS